MCLVWGLFISQLGFTIATSTTSRSSTRLFTTGTPPPDNYDESSDHMDGYRISRSGWLVSTPVLVLVVVGSIMFYYIKKRRMQFQRARLQRSVPPTNSPTIATVSHPTGGHGIAHDALPPSYEMVTQQRIWAPPTYEEAIKSPPLPPYTESQIDTNQQSPASRGQMT